MKNTDRLEEFVKAHRSEFDIFEPSPDVWNRISGENKTIRLRHAKTAWIRVAAAAVVVLGLSAVIVNYTLLRGKEKLSEAENPEIRELMETESFYAQKVDGKLQEIRRCYNLFPELKYEIESDLNELETMYKSLQNDLKDNVSNKEVIEAMIENNRNRLELVESVLNRINC